ncbi:E3 ubiquitin-protein ligase MIB2 [Schistocerca gregaria]|uniref:E3 ubiquitin-protein ligase MIB2 n=1 Tax=Schistocerca gregaria TaxID=7010 RepID=UPI00211DEB9F|nr:E3 ubiquitin-protein ligase MIB2 [Schistocerca gregaria]
MVELGVRVVRGPDWCWGEQDGGEGHAGTVVEVGRTGSGTSPEGTVVVQWDAGMRTNYRTGYQGAYDLRVVDNAPAGVRHPNIKCDACFKHGIRGMRWKCVQCYDFDICTQCYMADKHDTDHAFERFETNRSVGVDMPPRKGGVKLQLKGIFIGAKVVRGPSWDWGNQDGGEGKTGRVIDIHGWDNESGRSVANVTWTSGSTNVYRVGHRGKVDLKCVQEASGGSYYRDHLPVLGAVVGICRSSPNGGTVVAPRRHLTFNVGERVKVTLDVASLKQLQEGHGGWNPRMANYIGTVGTVHRVTERGDIRVRYEGCNNRWTLHPAALTKVNTFAVGDTVRVKDDLALVREYQKGHGEWSEAMRPALGKLGQVTRVYGDGDLRVCVDNETWTLNPQSVTLVTAVDSELSNTMGGRSADRQDHASPLAALLQDLVVEQAAGSIDRLVREAAQGHADTVRDFITSFPDKVDGKSGGKTCLQVACHQGHTELVTMLLDAGASLVLPDDEGDTALHYAAFGNQPEIMQLLLSRGADIDAVNRGHCTALHVAVNKQHAQCVSELLKKGCNVNIQDLYGDTALHDAICKESAEITDMLCAVPNIDFTLRNRRGFNVLQHAALKGNNFATERLLQRARQMVDVKKDDGFAALHLACLNGHRAVAETLLSLGRADVGLRNNRRQTALLLAVSQGHCSVVELVVSTGGDVNAEDEDGDTGLHLALMKRASICTQIHELEAPAIYGIYTQLLQAQRVEEESPVALAIACYLVQEGCSLSKRNHRGKSPLDLVAGSPHLADLLQAYNVQGQPAPAAAATASPNGTAGMSGSSSSSSSSSSNSSSAGHAHRSTAAARQADSSAQPQPQPAAAERADDVAARGTRPALNCTAAGAATVVDQPGRSATPDATASPAAAASPHPLQGVPARPHSAPPAPPPQAVEARAQSHGHSAPPPVECAVCSELGDENVRFEPCGHRVTCEECASRVKKCLRCGQVVNKRITSDGRTIACKSRHPSAERLRYLESKIAEIEETHCCSICMERRRNVAFLCGHGACAPCSATLRTCHMCRKTITRKINLY